MALNGTMELIETVTVGSGGAANITFSNIPQTYTDLKIVLSSRVDSNSSSRVDISFNGSTSNFTNRYLFGNGSSPSSGSNFGRFAAQSCVLGDTTSTFSNNEIIVPNYTGSANKSYSSDGVTETNGTQAYMHLVAGLWSDTSAITIVTLTPGAGNFVEHSTATLYGISKVTAPIKATGGTVYDDANYVYHLFASSGTFTPLQNLTVDYLVVAGGGGGGTGTASAESEGGGGGGAGGLRSTVTATGGGGSLESPLSLTSNTNYTVTVGAGGAGVTSTANVNGSPGSNSVFSTITSTGGGYGGKGQTDGGAGGSGGGGGAGPSGGGEGDGGAGTANQGYAGGNGSFGATSAGGGGAGAAGGNAASYIPGDGGSGVAVSITGTSVYYAGGGGGSGLDGATGAGGLGGGGRGGTQRTSPLPGLPATANTGGGGGGGGTTVPTSGAGGSGIVIVRYAR